MEGRLFAHLPAYVRFTGYFTGGELAAELAPLESPRPCTPRKIGLMSITSGVILVVSVLFSDHQLLCSDTFSKQSFNIVHTVSIGK